MTYSSALYLERRERPGRAPRQRKYRALAETTRIGPDHHVLEIGCGWGGFAEFAAKEIGARVTGLTISQEQYDYAQEADLRAGPRRPGRHQAAGLPRRDAARMTASPRSRCSRRSASNIGRSISTSWRERLKPGGIAGAAGHHDPGPLLRDLSPRDGLHPPLHLPGRHAALAGHHEDHLARR